MNNQKLIIYEFEELYRILIEINNDVNLIIKKASKNDISYFISQPNTLILTQKKIAGLDNQIIFIACFTLLVCNLPIKPTSSPS